MRHACVACRCRNTLRRSARRGRRLGCTRAATALPGGQHERTWGAPGSWSCTAAHAFSERMTWPPCAASLQTREQGQGSFSDSPGRREGEGYVRQRAAAARPQERVGPSAKAQVRRSGRLNEASHLRGSSNPGSASPQLLHTLHRSAEVVGGHVVRSGLLPRHAAGAGRQAGSGKAMKQQAVVQATLQHACPALLASDRPPVVASGAQGQHHAAEASAHAHARTTLPALQRAPDSCPSCPPVRPSCPRTAHLTVLNSQLWWMAIATRGPLKMGLPSGASSVGAGRRVNVRLCKRACPGQPGMQPDRRDEGQPAWRRWAVAPHTCAPCNRRLPINNALLMADSNSGSRKEARLRGLRRTCPAAEVDAVGPPLTVQEQRLGRVAEAHGVDGRGK